MKFFIFCPIAITGGPEALHQLCGELNVMGFDSYMYYYDSAYNKIQNHIIPSYSHYNVKISPYNSLIELDKDDHVIVVPEITPRNLFSGDYKAKLIYWFLACGCFYEDPELQKYYIACQSQEAYDRISNTNLVKENRIFLLTDYTRQNFIMSEEILKSSNRKDTIVYFPGKGLKHSQKIISLMPQYNFVPIQNLSSDQIKELGLISKIYIDFGHHPGKDRIPREMASTGCVVITGTQNVGANDIDIPLGKRKFNYDMNTDSYDYSKIVEQIKYDIDNYEISFEEQKNYRETIRNEKITFQKEIHKIANLLLSK